MALELQGPEGCDPLPVGQGQQGSPAFLVGGQVLADPLELRPGRFGCQDSGKVSER
ncbi:MAG: hypothetical protein Kow00100_23850 [Geothermobacteraceae bacterium]